MVALTDFTFAFEMATGSTPKTSAPSYTALTTYVMAGEGMTLSRGRQSEQAATAQPGRASVKLRNTDNRFTMGNGSSPYAPLQLRRPCRFRVTYSATTYDLWQGFVDDWGNGRDELTGVARLSLSDRIARAAKAELGAAIDDEILSDAPMGYYPLGEPEGSAFAADVAGKGAPPLTARPTPSRVVFGVGSQPGPDGGTQASFPDVATAGSGWLATETASAIGPATTAWTMEFVCYLPPTAATGNLFEWDTFTVFTAGGGGAIQVRDNFSASNVTAQIIVPGDPFHAAMVATWSGGNITTTTYINGRQADTKVTASGVGGGGATAAITLGFNADLAQMSNVAVYNTALSAARVAAHASALQSWSGETTTTRFNRLCRNAGLPTAFYTTSGTTDTVMGPQPTAGKSLLDAVNECATAEGGVAYVSDTGVLTFATSRTRYNTSVGVTLDATKAGQVSADTEIPTTDQDLINDSSATRYGGPTFRTVDTASVDAYDLHDESETLYLALDAHALNWTQWRVAQFDTPAPRLNEVPVNVVGYANSGGNVANLLNAEIGTKLQVTNLPADVSATSSLTLMVEGIRDEIRKDQWVRTFTTSPLGLNDTGWILGTDTLGVGTTLAY